MGFLNDFAKGFSGNSNSFKYRDIFDGLDESDSDGAFNDANYSKGYSQKLFRENVVRNSDSNYGWYTCPNCGRKFRLSDGDADHINSRHNGGVSTNSNGQLLCAHCNRQKSGNSSNADAIRRRKELENRKREDAAFLREVDKVLKADQKKKSSKTGTTKKR